MPLYVAADSVDVWVNPTLYKLDDDYKPRKVAGVPPDYFCEDGQLWGNPVYDYQAHEKDNFNWWTNRLVRALEVFDYVRIDHFRGLDRYFEIDCDKENAKEGVWIDVPSEELFNRIHQTVDRDRIIAEDLGIIDDGVRELLKFTGYPGMKILSFAFNGDKGNLYLPERIEENSVCYTGTHDNDTLLGLIYSATEWDKNNLVFGVKSSLDKMGIFGRTDDDESLKDSIIELGFASKANLFISPFADLLGRWSDYRINEPGTCSEKNWSVRFLEKDFSDSLALKIKTLTEKYKR
jgi:4-alpha-glucanotransferase